MKEAKMKKFLFALLIATLITAGAIAGGQGDKAYPNRPVTAIVPWDVGGTTDTLARALLTVTGQYFPQPIVVANKPGGGTVVGMMEFIKA